MPFMRILISKDQTIYIPKIRTKALDAIPRLNQGKSEQQCNCCDTKANLLHLLPGKTYAIMKVFLMTSAEALMVNGRDHYCRVLKFVQTTPGGTVDVTFNFTVLHEIGGEVGSL